MKTENKTNLTFRPFTNSDYQGWAGAEDFTDGTSPMIADTDAAVVILDDSGIGVWFSDGVTMCAFLRLEGVHQDFKQAIAKTLPAELTPENLSALGFKIQTF